MVYADRLVGVYIGLVTLVDPRKTNFETEILAEIC
jgi:hypothetical protein